MHFCQTTRPITKFGTLTNIMIYSAHYGNKNQGKILLAALGIVGFGDFADRYLSEGSISDIIGL